MVRLEQRDFEEPLEPQDLPVALVQLVQLAVVVLRVALDLQECLAAQV